MSKFTLKMLGARSALSVNGYNNNAILNNKLLIDAGVSIQYALRDAKIEPKDLEGVIVTHIHGDHTGGLEYLGFYGKFVANKKFKLYVPEDIVDDLWNKTLAGGMEDLSHGEKATLEDYFEVTTYKYLETFNAGGLEILPISVTHVPNKYGDKKPAYSFLIDDRVYYSSDTLFDKELLEQLNTYKVEAIFHDCQLFHTEDGVHTSLDELETLDKDLKKKIKVMHYGDNIEDYRNRIEENGISIVEEFKEYKF